jgi:hypothetical protein
MVAALPCKLLDGVAPVGTYALELVNMADAAGGSSCAGVAAAAAGARRGTHMHHFS